jgi:sec-independent protein translocase protein TatC
VSSDERVLTFTGHLIELRQRLIKSLLALLICAGISFAFAGYLLEFLKAPAGDLLDPLYFTEATGFISSYAKIALAGGIILAMPVLVYQGFMFLSPAMTRREKRYVYIILPWIILMFAGGVAFAYFILVPPAVKFLLTWRGFAPFGLNTQELVEPIITIQSYVSIATKFMVTVGIAFETPVIITLLARFGIVKPEWLSGKRKWAYILCFIVGAAITPTFDPVNQTLVAVPLVILFEMSILLARIAYRKKKASDTDYLAD